MSGPLLVCFINDESPTEECNWLVLRDLRFHLINQWQQLMQLLLPLFEIPIGDRPVTVTHARKEGLHGIVVFLTERIELVIVTTRAPECQPKKGCTRADDDFIERILTCETF